jgi:hypothetical protein
MKNDEYRKKWERKMEWYRLSDIVLANEAKNNEEKRLIITMDKADGGIDSQEVLKIIKNVIKGE